MKGENRKKVIIVGAGISGLTAGAYLVQNNFEVLILEKSLDIGGLVNTFNKDDFYFDTGPRVFGNAGILIPMLEDLEIELPLVKGYVSTGIKDKIIHYHSNKDIEKFINSLKELFPESLRDIKKIER